MGLQFREVVFLVRHDHIKKKNNNNNKITQRSRKVAPWGCPWVVPFVSLPYELFLAASVVAGQYELCHLFYLSLFVSSITVQYVQSQVGCVVLLVNDLFLVVPFVRGQYELFLARLWKVRYFLCCHLLLRIMRFLVVYYGALLQCRSNFRWVLVTGPCDVIW